MTDELIERLPEKFRQSFEVCSDGCWRWKGWLCPQGYGHCYHEGKRIRTHRLFYQLLVGPIPSHLVCDHLCYVRDCVNPAHIELVTSAVNVKRGHERREREGRPAPNLRTHCRRGHEFTAANTLMHWRGRTCRMCQYANQQRYRRRDKAAGRKDKIVELSERIAVQDDLLSAGSVCMTPQERVRWIDRVRAHLDASERSSLIKEGRDAK